MCDRKRSGTKGNMKGTAFLESEKMENNLNMQTGVQASVQAGVLAADFTVLQRMAIGFAAGVVGAIAVVVFSHILSGLGVSARLGVPSGVSLKSPDIYRPLFWGGLWGILFGLLMKPAWNHVYIIGFLFVLAPLLALFLYFLPRSGAGYFGLNKGPMFTLYLLLVNLPFGIVTALVARAIIGKHP
jgi:hypothetical protein